MTTRVRISHLDSSLPIEIDEIQRNVNDAAAPVQRTRVTHLPAKGDEFEFYIHSGCYLIVREALPSATDETQTRGE